MQISSNRRTERHASDFLAQWSILESVEIGMVRILQVLSLRRERDRENISHANARWTQGVSAVRRSPR